MIFSPLHNCIQVNLEIQYFKQKLTEFYKENKSLRQKVAELNKENEKFLNKKFRDVDSQTDSSKSVEVNKPTSSSSKIPISIHNRMTPIVYHTKCSVCSNDKFNAKQDFKMYSKIQLDKRSIGVNTFDSDIYNKQNKVKKLKIHIL
jgi:hypothetical protein